MKFSKLSDLFHSLVFFKFFLPFILFFSNCFKYAYILWFIIFFFTLYLLFTLFFRVNPLIWVPLSHLCRLFSKYTFLVLNSLLCFCAVSPVKCCLLIVQVFCCHFKQNTSVSGRVQEGNRWHIQRANGRYLMNKPFTVVWAGLGNQQSVVIHPGTSNIEYLSTSWPEGLGKSAY